MKPDFSRARALLEELLGTLYDKQTRLMLAAIALRETDRSRLIRILQPVSGHLFKHTLIAAAHWLGGDHAAARAIWLAPPGMESMVFPSFHGFVAEADGDLETAARHYLDEVEIMAGRTCYGELGLRRIAARIGKPALARIVRERQAARDRGKVELRSVDDFHRQLGAIGDALRAKLGISAPKQPMRDPEIDQIRLATVRRGRGATVGVPASVRTILRYDKNFRTHKDARPLLEPIWSARGAVMSTDIEKLVRQALRDDDSGIFPPALSRLPATVPIWSDAADLPACIPLAHPGDQRVFLYMGGRRH